MNVYSLVDFRIILPTLGLLGLSFSLLASTSPNLVGNFLLFVLFGFFCLFAVASIDYRHLLRFRWIFYAGAVVLLLILFFSPSIRGSARWIDIGIFRVQPSELMKPFIIVVLASIISQERKTTLLSFIKHLFILLPIVALIFKQPDLGNTIVYLGTFLMMEILNGFPLKYILGSLTIFGAFTPAMWSILKEYQRARILSFLNPSIDPRGVGYNALQAIIAIGSGQLFGMGLGRGTQSHLLFLPEYHTDFVFASLVEELGFLGGVFVLIFYMILLMRFLAIAKAANDTFGRLIAIGLFAQIFIQVFVNIGMNLALLPITGITLPLISYGGSSTVATFIDFGLLTSIMVLNKNRAPIVIR